MLIRATTSVETSAPFRDATVRSISLLLIFATVADDRESLDIDGCHMYGFRARISLPGSSQSSEVRCEPGTVPQR
jgi:hypothetical protein